MSENDLYAQALAAVNARDPERARLLLATLVAAEPRRAEAWLLLSTLVDDVDQSIECLQHVVALDPGNAKARHWLSLAARARVRREAGQPEGEPEPTEDPDADFVPLAPEDEPVPRLGRYLLDFGFVAAEQLDAALARQAADTEAPHARPLGGILLEQGDLTPERLAFALREQRRVRLALGLPVRTEG